MNTLSATNQLHEKNNLLDVMSLRKDFPILQQTVHGKPLIYLDSAATSQKPQVVIDALVKYYQEYNSNVHRGVHTLSEKATFEYEKARIKVQQFIHAKYPSEVIFLRGTTEAINLVATSFGRSQIKAQDEIIISEMEHHSNIVPWQLLCEQIGAVLKILPMNDAGEVSLDEFQKLLSPKTKMVSIVHVSNSLGTVNPIKKIIQLAHQYNVPVLIDGAQAISHFSVDVQDLDCDFYAFSGHKLFADTGIGVLYGKTALLDAMPPYQGGGEMIRTVTFDKTTFNELPHKFEAGTPHIAGAISLGIAIDYLQKIGIETIHLYEHELLLYANSLAAQMDDLRIIGNAIHKSSILSFTLSNIHAHDIGTILDQDGIAIRVGHHCTMPVMQHFKLPATARASFAFYNTKQEIDQLFESLDKVKKVFA